MIPNFETPAKEKFSENIFVAILALTLIITALCFTGIGVFNLVEALFTGYSATTLDLMYFTSGITILFFVTITSLLGEIKKQNKTIAKGILHMLKQRLQGDIRPQSPFGNVLKDLFSKQPGMQNDDVSGSISLFDPNDPDNPIFQGDFKNAEEMDNIKKNLIEKMLNSQRDFKGKKITKQEMLDSLNLKDLRSELKQAIDAEDWLWAASLRDKIAEKENKRKGGDQDQNKNISPEM